MLLISLDYRMGEIQPLQFCRWIHAMSFLIMSWYQTWVNYVNSSVFLSIFTTVFVVFDSALSLVAWQLQELCWYSYVTMWRRHREMPFEHTLTQVGLYEWFFYCNFVDVSCVHIVHAWKFVDAETEKFPTATKLCKMFNPWVLKFRACSDLQKTELLSGLHKSRCTYITLGTKKYST